MAAKKLTPEEHRLSLIHRFWSKVEVMGEDDCWEWKSPSIAAGYGVIFTIKDDRYVGIASHRCSWELHYGPIPDSEHVLHRCDNGLCVNPRHLFLGSNADNIKDRVSKGRSRKSALGMSAISTIRADRANGVERKVLAERYGVSGPLISAICAGKVGGPLDA